MRLAHPAVDEPFRPWPLLANPHLQTILSLWMKRGRLPGPTRRYVVALPDGDRMVMHENVPPGWRPSDPVALVIHGLTGTHRSGAVVLQAERLADRGVRVFRLDLRGAGAGFRLARGCYNAGCTDDVRAALRVVRELAPDGRLLIFGTSLGGNIALKLAAEDAATNPWRIDRVAALNPPIDLDACVADLERPSNWIYEWHFVGELRTAAVKRAWYFREASPRFPKRLRLREFDDLYTAPRGGYDGVADYYRRAASAPLIPQIKVPTLILTARDDPFIAADPFERLTPPPNVTVRIADRGGHTGFLGRDGRGGTGWAERHIAEWLCP